MGHRFKLVGVTKVVDEAGDVTLEQFFGIYSLREPPNTYVLTWKGRKIGFEAEVLRDLPHDANGHRVFALKVGNFGEQG